MRILIYINYVDVNKASEIYLHTKSEDKSWKLFIKTTFSIPQRSDKLTNNSQSKHNKKAQNILLIN